MGLISVPRSVIPACDVDISLLETIVKETAGVQKIGAYKIGFFLGLEHGLKEVMKVIRKHTDKPVIYDHQKAGTDIPDTGGIFAEVCAKAGVDAVILFPQSGPVTQEKWIKEAFNQGLAVIVGGDMTHKGYKVSDGGYIADEAVMRMYLKAAELGVTDFVVPGNKSDSIKLIRSQLEAIGVKPTFYAPGFVAQGGEISEAAGVAGDNWHAIVGRGIYKAENIKQAAIKLTSKL